MGIPVYPNSVIGYDDKQDHVDAVIAAHINSVQDEVVALETHVGAVGLLPDLTAVGTSTAVEKRISPMIDALATWAYWLNTNKVGVASPTLTGVPRAPTAAAGNSSTQIATTAFVTGAIGNTGTVLASKANINSPVFTGTPSAPTPSPGQNNTRLATTAYVDAANYVTYLGQQFIHASATITSGTTFSAYEMVQLWVSHDMGGNADYGVVSMYGSAPGEFGRSPVVWILSIDSEYVKIAMQWPEGFGTLGADTIQFGIILWSTANAGTWDKSTNQTLA